MGRRCRTSFLLVFYYSTDGDFLMAAGLTVALIFGFMGYAVSKGRSDVILSVGGYLLAFVAITILLITGCAFLYTKFIHYLWTTGMAP